MCINVIKIEVPDKSVVTVYVQISDYFQPTLKNVKFSLYNWKFTKIYVIVYLPAYSSKLSNVRNINKV